MSRQSGEVLAQRYVIQHEVRTGGMGAVYRAFDHRENRVVALKELRLDVSASSGESLRDKFMQEAQLLGTLRHPQVPRVWDFFVDGDLCCIIMEFIEGENLKAALQQHKASHDASLLPHNDVIRYAIQVCGILRYLHDRNIIHRDVKPSNLILRKGRSDVVLVDFGLALTKARGDTARKLAAGTVGYAPKEQMRGEASPQSDIYGLGATMYFLMSGRDPDALHVKSPREVCRFVQADLADVVEKATREEPQERFASAGEMEQALRRVLQLRGSAAREGIGFLRAARAPKTRVPAGTPPSQPEDERRAPSRWAFFRTRPTDQDLAVFTRQLAVLTHTGIALDRALWILGRQNRNTPLFDPIARVSQAVSQGQSIAAAFATESQVFGPIFVALLAAGEDHGRIDLTLQQLADYAERDKALRERVRSALAYPLLVLGVTAALTYFAVMFMVPPFLQILASMNQQLPLCTRMLIVAVNSLQDPTLVGVGIAIAIGAAYCLRWVAQERKTRAAVGGLLLTAPAAGRLIQKVVLARVGRCLGTMLRSGISVSVALSRAADICLNSTYQESLLHCMRQVTAGTTLTEAFNGQSDRLYPPLFVGLLSAGELSGTLDTMLLRAAEAYEQDVQYQLETLLSLIEPLMMLLTAFIVGYILFSLFLPMGSLLRSLT